MGLFRLISDSSAIGEKFFFFFFFNDTATTEIYTFPYTTLFRSAQDGHERHRAGSLADRGVQLRRRDRDRKSTRLNSSHSQISYAVFCLKKKKKKKKRLNTSKKKKSNKQK